MTLKMSMIFENFRREKERESTNQKFEKKLLLSFFLLLFFKKILVPPFSLFLLLNAEY